MVSVCSDGDVTKNVQVRWKSLSLFALIPHMFELSWFLFAGGHEEHAARRDVPQGRAQLPHDAPERARRRALQEAGQGTGALGVVRVCRAEALGGGGGSCVGSGMGEEGGARGRVGYRARDGGVENAGYGERVAELTACGRRVRQT